MPKPARTVPPAAAVVHYADTLALGVEAVAAPAPRVTSTDLSTE